MDEKRTGPLVVVMSRRQWLFFRALRADASASVFEAWEAVSSTAIEHPEWDMEETRTMSDWDREHE
jgi:hypothetical protein